MGILITSSRRPNPRLRTFCKDLARVLPDAIKVNRGKMSIEEVALKAYQLKIDHVVIVGKGRGGNPGRLIFIKVYEDRYEVLPLIIGIHGVTLIREIPEASIPTTVKTAVIAIKSECLKVGESLSDSLGLPFIEVSRLQDTQGLSDIILWIDSLKQ
ncbi:MAG: hypothetical protein DRJ52_02930, partial [Thermoprotei archaeon]